jgi:hypothetical protein
MSHPAKGAFDPVPSTRRRASVTVASEVPGPTEVDALVRLRFRPLSPTGHLALVGRGVMYDSGGISLKPSDESHAQMKNDMTGAAAILGAMTAARERAIASGVATGEQIDDLVRDLRAARSGSYEWVSTPFFLDLAFRKPVAG